MRARTSHGLAAMAVVGAVSLSMAVMTSCSGSDSAGHRGTTRGASARAHRSTSSQHTRSARALDGAGLFRTHCSACHGATGEGNLGPSLVGIADRLGLAEQLDVVHTGKGRMPPFSPALNDAQIVAVVEYTRSLR